ncbi:MAG: putative transporter [Prevotella sp.]|jgi:AspT/YidE/YbjL antiporter-like protein|nr:putative transporter [Prevotella sp.]
MDWLQGLFTIHSSVQTVVVVALIIATGLALGKFKVGGISLGVAFVFFIGILAGHLHLSVDATVLDFIETFGLAMFVYCLGLHVGPNFFGSLREEGVALNLWSLGIIVLGTVFAVVLIPLTHISLPDMVGILCGATTNTPALGAATQALAHHGLPTGSVALATAVTYPLGVLGVIVAMVIIRKLFVKPTDLKPRASHDDHTYIVEFTVVNPAVHGKTIMEVAQMTHLHFVISRIWRNNQVIVPMANTVLHKNDSLLVITTPEDEPTLEMLFGKRETRNWNRESIDWNAIDNTVESRVIVMTNTHLNGKRLGHINLRKAYGVNVSRVIRGDLKLLAEDNLILQYGDRVTVVGKHENLDEVEAFLGNAVKTLEEPNLGNILFGIVLGMAIGTIPISLPGMEQPIRLGIAGGPILMGILVGAIGPRLRLVTYTTRSASLMLRKLGLSLYLACLGLDAGKDFFATVVRPEGLMWVGIGFLVTLIPVLVLGIIALKTHKYDFGTICGILCGSMANPMALGYANDTLRGDSASISYATVYPIGMFARVIIAQLLIMFAL